MGTKNNPGEFDCYANAAPDEPMFVLLARDFQAPALIEEWARCREQRGDAVGKVQEARECASAMTAWRNAHYCLDFDCRHPGGRHEGGRCNGGTIYGRCDCYGFKPDLSRPILPPPTGEWLLLLVCCGRHGGYQVCATADEAKEFRTHYVDDPEHERQAILSRLVTPIRVGSHDETDPEILRASSQPQPGDPDPS